MTDPVLRPIGFVRSVKGNLSEIEVLPEYRDGLYRIGENDGLIILFLFDRSDAVKMRVHPMGDPNNPEVGVFASRGPDRPNHIGVTSVKLVRVDGTVLMVEGLDAWEGTPVLDIKPEGRQNTMPLRC